MQIGELSRLTGASPRSLRHYEARGLITSERLDNGYRVYDEDALLVVRNVRTLLAAGLTLADIGRVGECLFTQDLSQTEVCDHVLELYRNRIATVQAHLEATTDTRDRLHAELTSLEERAQG